MKFGLIIRPLAEMDLSEAMSWYELQSVGLGDKFHHFVDKKFRQIAAHPEHYPKRYKNIRIALVEKFPFVIYFEVMEMKLVVHSVYHSSRSQRGLKTRLK